MVKRIGPNTESCGTPLSTAYPSETFKFIRLYQKRFLSGSPVPNSCCHEGLDNFVGRDDWWPDQQLLPGMEDIFTIPLQLYYIYSLDVPSLKGLSQPIPINIEEMLDAVARIGSSLAYIGLIQVYW